MDGLTRVTPPTILRCGGRRRDYYPLRHRPSLMVTASKNIGDTIVASAGASQPCGNSLTLAVTGFRVVNYPFFPVHSIPYHLLQVDSRDSANNITLWWEEERLLPTTSSPFIDGDCK
ncbi:hypothetical protein J6590_033577 [Homalodisca vitripennis]|nr:hypothetical protein J6590_033577 [Homalodisca vitripennis]